MSDEHDRQTHSPVGCSPQALECVLFVAGEPVPISRLAEVLQVEVTELPALLRALEAALEGRGLQLVQLAGGYSLATRPEYADHVQRLLQPKAEQLSVQALETLTIVAYRQPITRPEIDEIRGVNSSGVVTSLLEKDLIRITGRRDAPGRPFMFATTPKFLTAFGLRDLDELPDFGELQQRLARQAPLGNDREAGQDRGFASGAEKAAGPADTVLDGRREEASASSTEGQDC